MRILLLLIITWLMVSCTGSKYSKYEDAINAIIPEQIDTKDSRVLVIPRAGCSGCISDATIYVLENYKNFKNTYVVFTEIDDIKNLNHLLPNDFLNYPNIFIDSGNTLLRGELKSSYPLELFYKNGSIIEVKEFAR